MSLAETCVREDNFDLSGRPDLISFWPELIIIYDDRGRRVLVGQVRLRDIQWCSPVSSSAEASDVSSQIAKIYSEAAYERGCCDNHYTANMLHRDARVLKGRLIRPFWRDHARAAIAAVTA